MTTATRARAHPSLAERGSCMRRPTPPSITSSYLPVIGPVGAELRHEFTFDHSIGRHTSPSVVDSFPRADFASERACSQSYFPIVSTLTPCRPSVRQAGNSAPALCACQPCLFTLNNLSEIRINRTGPQSARVLAGSALQLKRTGRRGPQADFSSATGHCVGPTSLRTKSS